MPSMYRYNSSTSSIWGSASSHLGSDGQRPYNSMDSLSADGDAPVTLDITIKSGHSAQLVGSREVLCKSQAECKANKLNRNEQTKLENVQFRVIKEKEMSARRFNQYEKSIRAKSAKLMGRIRTLEHASLTESQRPRSYAYEKPASRALSRRTKPITEPEVKKKYACEICQKIQNIIYTYENDGACVEVINDDTDHSMCVFTDVQVNTFIHLLENKYFGKTPSLEKKDSKREIRSSISRLDRQASKKAILSREEINNAIARKNIEQKIRQFCEELDKVNKEERNIPQEVKDAVEKWRMENAILLSQKPPTLHEQITNEVRRILKLT